MNKWLEKYGVAILGMIGLLIVALLLAVIIRWRPAATIVIEPPPPTPTPGPVRVYVSGEVQTTGIYTLPPGAIVQDAIDAAGGPTSNAELERFNLARILTAGEHIYVPGTDDVTVNAVSTDGNEPAATRPVNINIATPEELETLPGIGPALASAIIEYREANGPFQAIEDIQNVSGIGPATFEDLQDLITIN